MGVSGQPGNLQLTVYTEVTGIPYISSEKLIRICITYMEVNDMRAANVAVKISNVLIRL